MRCTGMVFMDLTAPEASPRTDWKTGALAGARANRPRTDGIVEEAALSLAVPSVEESAHPLVGVSPTGTRTGFVRGRHVRLVLNHARTTLHDFARLRGDIDNLRGIVSGEVTIATLDSLTVHFLPETVARFVATHPAVQIRAIATDPVEAMYSVAQGNADLGLTFSPARRRGIALLADVPSPMCAIMTPDHELAARKSVTLDECGACRLMYQDHSASMQPFFGNEMEAFKNAHKPVAISNTLAVLKRLLLRGVGIAFYTRLGGSPRSWTAGVWSRCPSKGSGCRRCGCA